MSLRRLRDLQPTADEPLDETSRIAQRLANAFPELPVGAIPAARATQGGRRAAPLLVRVVAVVALLVVGVAASAAIGKLARYLGARPATPSAIPPVPTPAPRTRSAPPRAVAPPLAPAVEIAAPPDTAPAPAPTPAPHAATPRPRDARPSSAPREEDYSTMLDAVRALRAEHDPARALALVERYLAAHPTGALAEEASAVAVEAATAMHAAGARSLAERYLARYPEGRYAEAARRALATP